VYSEQQLAEGCQRFNQSMQKAVYEKYAAKMRSVCLRYAKDRDEVKDILQEGFVKVFTNIESFKWQGDGSFVAWIKKVMINTAITFYNKYTKRVKEVKLEDSVYDEEKNPVLAEDQLDSRLYDSAQLTGEELMGVLEKVPMDFRIVFNMYVLEGMNHKEIAKMLDIKTETSRTRLLRAKVILKDEILKLDKSIAEIYR
jgi:RNA polymerase sigma-70 factor, ECF subfamily